MATESEWRSRLALLAAVVILVAWAGSFTVDIWVETYDPHPSITPLALAAAGFLFGGEVVTKLKRSNGATHDRSRTPDRTPD